MLSSPSLFHSFNHSPRLARIHAIHRVPQSIAVPDPITALSSKRAFSRTTPSFPLQLRPRPANRNLRFSSYATSIAGIGIGLSLYQSSTNTIHCEPAVPASKGGSSAPGPAPLPPPPPSSVNVYELSFGTVCGVCAGVFVKKGAKLLAFAFGGIFVLLQYLGSQSLIRVDWARIAQRFENLVYSKDAQGHTRAPTIGSLIKWLVDFLTADFQQRASFVAGFALGLRLG